MGEPIAFRERGDACSSNRLGAAGPSPLGGDDNGYM